MEIEWGKLGTIAVILTSATLLAATGKMAPEAVGALYILVLGYVFGNGRLAAKGKEPQPLLKPSPERRGERRRAELEAELEAEGPSK